MRKTEGTKQFTSDEVVAYICAVSSELSIMAADIEKPMLAYFLKMVEEEAQDTLTKLK